MYGFWIWNKVSLGSSHSFPFTTKQDRTWSSGKYIFTAWAPLLFSYKIIMCQYWHPEYIANTCWLFLFLYPYAPLFCDAVSVSLTHMHLLETFTLITSQRFFFNKYCFMTETNEEIYFVDSFLPWLEYDHINSRDSIICYLNKNGLFILGNRANCKVKYRLRAKLGKDKTLLKGQ